MAPTIRVRNPKGSGANTSEPSFSSGEYLLYWDRKQKAVVVVTGPFKGRIWTTNRKTFFSRRWRYVGILDGRRIKRINYLANVDWVATISDGLRKIYMSSVEPVPAEFRRILNQGTSS